MTKLSSAAEAYSRNSFSTPVILIGVLIVAAKIGVFLLFAGPQLIWDSHWHLALAEHIGRFGQYPFGEETFRVKYPPAFPVAAAALGVLFDNFAAGAAALVWLSSLGLCFLTFQLGKLYGRSTGIVAALLFAGHHLSLVHSNLILTEQFFALCALLSLALALKANSSAKSFAAAILLAGVASLTRYEGVLLFPILAISWLARSKPIWRPQLHPLVLAAALAIALCWWLWLSAVLRPEALPGKGIYGAELSLFGFGRAADFLTLAFWLGPIFVLAALFGAVKILKNSSRAAIGFLAFALLYLFSHVCWWYTDIRFYLPLLPLLSITAAHSVVGLATKVSHTSRTSLFLPLAIVLGVLSWEQFQMFKAPNYEYRRYNSLYLRQYDLVKNVAVWARQNLPGAIIAVPEFLVYTHYLDHKVIPYSQIGKALTTSGEKLYVVIDNMHFRDEEMHAGMGGSITVETPAGELKVLRTTVLYKTEGHLTLDDDRYAAILEITGTLPGEGE